jgi:hypothetical protein
MVQKSVHYNQSELIVVASSSEIVGLLPPAVAKTWSRAAFTR